MNTCLARIITTSLFYCADIYVKVTLFEGSRVIKAKKTRPLSCAEVLHFNEKFSIRLPSSYLDSVSCVVSLCSRWANIKGTKLKHRIYDIFAGINLESKQ